MEYKYVQFPLCLVTETYKNREKGLSLMLDFGLVHYALSQKYEIGDVVRQTIYDFYKNTDKLPRDLRVAIEEAAAEGQFTQDEDYNGFNSDGKFDPELNAPELLRILENNPDIKEEAVRHYQLHQAGEFLNIKILSAKGMLKSYHEVQGIRQSFERVFGPDAMVSVKPSMLFEYLKNPKQDIDLLRAYLGIVSMIGYRKFISTNKPAILSRMIGAKSKAAFQSLSKLTATGDTVTKYSKRWNMDKLMLSLAEHKFIMFLSKKQTSVIYVSRYMEPQELADLVRQSRNRYDIKKKIQDATASL